MMSHDNGFKYESLGLCGLGLSKYSHNIGLFTMVGTEEKYCIGVCVSIKDVTPGSCGPF